MFNEGKNAWLDAKDTGAHAWWEHKATPGHNAIFSAVKGAIVSAPQTNACVFLTRLPRALLTHALWDDQG